MTPQSLNQSPDYPITRLPNSCAPDSRAPEFIGRAARLELVFERRRERTILAHAYAEPPFRIGRTFDLDGAAYVILVCSGPGIFAGDTLRQSIHVGRGARVVLTSQSALQVHPAIRPSGHSPVEPFRDSAFLRSCHSPVLPSCHSPVLPSCHSALLPSCPPALLPSCPPAILPSCPPAILPSCHSTAPSSCPPALLRQDYFLEDDAELHCLWDPVIPFAGARLDQRFDLRIAESSRLYWGDALMAGRVRRGEAWQFHSLAHELRLRIGPALAYLERYTLAPGDRAIERPWVCGGLPYLATAIVHHASATREAADVLHRQVAALAGVHAGVDLIAPRLVLARFLAENGAPFARARASCRAHALRSIFGRPELAARK